MIDESTGEGEFRPKVEGVESGSRVTKDETTQEFTADPTYREIIEDSKSDMENRRQAIDSTNNNSEPLRKKLMRT